MLAGGSGQRFGDPLPKQYHKVKGKPILHTTVETFLHHPAISDVIVVIGEKVASHYETMFFKPPKLHLPVPGEKADKRRFMLA